ncbi:MAG: YbaK/EbsC family protein, partial [Chloroflexi bacterium]|nr:YbaK/EbsC family protein [Chloroflexota bacterium]
KGAIAPLGLPNGIPVVFDKAIARCQRVNISSGNLMFGLELAGADLIRLSGASLRLIRKEGN